MGASLEWEWVLASGAKIRATLDLRANTESVWLEQRLVSRCLASKKPDGHVITFGPSTPYRSEDVRVVFHPATQTCALLVAGLPVQPAPSTDHLAPANAGASTGAGFVEMSLLPTKKKKRRWIVPVVLVSLVVLWGITSVIASQKRVEAARNKPLTQSLPAPNGLMVVHYPATFDGTVEKVVDERPADATFTQLKIAPREQQDGYLYLQAFPDPVSDDPELLARIIMGQNIKSWAKEQATFTEKRQGLETCLGEPGFVMEGIINTPKGKAKRWACTFLHNGHGYHFAYFVDVGSSEVLVRRIVDATELTGAPAPPSLEPGIQRHGGGGLVVPEGMQTPDLYQSK